MAILTTPLPTVTTVNTPAPAYPRAGALAALLGSAQDIGQVTHLEHTPGTPGTQVPWPTWVPASVAISFAKRGIIRPWSHQAHAANLARDGQHVIIATRAASGKSAAYLAPALTAIAEGGTVLYIAPTKALAADQLTTIETLDVPRLTAACADGDNTAAERAWAQSRASFLLTNPDTLHASILPAHAHWRGFFARLRLVIVDECHGYRGVFGSHVSHVLRRLRRVARQHAGREPVFILASATVAEPERTARQLTGLDALPVTDDGAPRAPVTFALLDPATAAPEAATRLLARLVSDDVSTLAFVRSRREAEAVASGASDLLGPRGDQVAAYRSGYLADERRAIEAGMRDGTLTGVAATTALELGISLPGLDAVLITGWPGSWASLWQQAGRAGRDGDPALVVFIARDDPLDRYLLEHPDVLLSHRFESVALDPGNPRVLEPHLEAAAAELPLTGPDLDLFGPSAASAATTLAADGRLRSRQGGWYGAVRGRTARQTDLRGAANQRVRVVERLTGRLVGTMDEPSAHLLAHEGAVYVHRGETYLVDELDLDTRIALVEARDPGYTTIADQVTEIALAGTPRQTRCGDASVSFGDVEVRTQVVSYRRSGRRARRTKLSLPPHTLSTRATWISIHNGRCSSLSDTGIDLAGAAHAVQHAAIGLLPLFAACDRWDVAGTSGAPHPATGEVTVFVYDGQEGGSGYAERGFHVAERWLMAARDSIAGCGCESGCPSCVHSPRCSSRNRSLSKTGAVALLDTLLGERPLE